MWCKIIQFHAYNQTFYYLFSKKKWITLFRHCSLKNEDNRPRILLGIIEEVKCNMLRTRTHVHYYYIDALQAKSIVFSNLFKLT